MRLRPGIGLFFIVISLVLLVEEGNAQGRSSDTTVIITDTTNIDALFKKARDLYFDENYSQARRICLRILEKKPSYYEVRTFLGRTYAWEKQYDNARTELSRVLIEKENDFEALSALFDVEFWTESYSVANDYLKIALGYYPNSEELLLKKAKLQIRIEEKDEAALTLRRILDLNPGQKEAIRMMNSLEGRKLNNNFQTSFHVDRYDKDKNGIHQYFSMELGRHFSFGSLTLRGNMADKFNKKGIQTEVESYAHITRTTYLNLLAGYSGVSIFPKEKYMIEAYQKIPKGFELSFGLRHLKFDLSNTTIYTGSLGNYYKDYYFSVRTFLTPKTLVAPDDKIDSTVAPTSRKTSVTVIGTVRTYFGDSDNYLGIRAGSGRSADRIELAQSEAANANNPDVTFLPSYSIGIELQRRAFGKWIIKADISYAKENIDKIKSTSSQRVSTSVTLKTVF